MPRLHLAAHRTSIPIHCVSVITHLPRRHHNLITTLCITHRSQQLQIWLMTIPTPLNLTTRTTPIPIHQIPIITLLPRPHLLPIPTHRQPAPHLQIFVKIFRIITYSTSQICSILACQTVDNTWVTPVSIRICPKTIRTYCNTFACRRIVI
jgi:hypothetical protein